MKRLLNTAHQALTNRTLFCWYLNKKNPEVWYRSVAKKKANQTSNYGLIYWCWLNNQVWDYCKAKDLCIPLLLFIFRKAQRLSPIQAHYFQEDLSITSLLPEGLACCHLMPNTSPPFPLTWNKVLAFEGTEYLSPCTKEFTPHHLDSLCLFLLTCLKSDHSISN